MGMKGREYREVGTGSEARDGYQESHEVHSEYCWLPPVPGHVSIV